MTDSFEEALAVLGIDGSTSTSDAHRAYIRRLKTCSPERDPKGFAELRAAYELVRSRLQTQNSPTVALAPVSLPVRDASPSCNSDPVQQAWRIENPEEWKTVHDALMRSVSGGDAKKEMPVLIAVETMGALVAIGCTDEARLLLGSLTNWIHIVGESRALPGDLAAHFPVIRDLVVVASLLPRDAAKWLGRHSMRLRFDKVDALAQAHVVTNAELSASVLKAIEPSQSVLAQQLRASIGVGRGYVVLRRRHRIRDRSLLVLIAFLFLVTLYWQVAK